MTTTDYQSAVLSACTAARLLAEHDLPALLAAISHAEIFGPMTDPTLYREKSQAMSEDKQILEAALPLWKLGRRLAERKEVGRG